MTKQYGHNGKNPSRQNLIGWLYRSPLLNNPLNSNRGGYKYRDYPIPIPTIVKPTNTRFNSNLDELRLIVDFFG